MTSSHARISTSSASPRRIALACVYHYRRNGRRQDVYCEKPLTYNIHEAVAVMAAAKKYKRILQTGAMQRSGFEFPDRRRTGSQRFASARSSMWIATLAALRRPHVDRKDIPMEPGLDWDLLWCGGAPLVEYNDKLSPRGAPRLFPWSGAWMTLFGSGYCGDWGAHHLDIAQWGLMDGNGR